jgi:ubiquinone/menaquinone biosynthesis C-methylase UbiE
MAVDASIHALPQTETLRILEVGIGKDLRVLRRDLYRESLTSALARGVSNIDLVGIDLLAPNPAALKDAQQSLVRVYDGKVNLQVLQGSITTGIPFTDGYFDVIVCCLTLCSVNDPLQALQEIQRTLRPTGGTLAYVEHVAVNPDEPYRFLEWQQQVLDPIQQVVADNCHLHRYTQDSIAQVFGSHSRVLHEERFMVDGMWPVSCQCCGVIQRV